KADEMRKRGRNPAGRWYRLRIALPDIQPATGNKTRPPGGKLSLRATGLPGKCLLDSMSRIPPFCIETSIPSSGRTMDAAESTSSKIKATTSELLDDAYDFSSRALRTGEVIVSGIAQGAVDYGKDKAKNHLPELLLEIGTGIGLGAAAVAGLALSPVWAGVAITGIGIAGTLIIAKNVGEGLRHSAHALKAAWRDPSYEAYARRTVGQNVGPIAFDLAVATASGMTGGMAAAGAASRMVPNYYAAKALKTMPLKQLTAHDAASAGSNTTYIPNIQAEIASTFKPRSLPFLKTATYEAANTERNTGNRQT
ncbi:MAG TPA: hypothetical protein V6D17_03440, partial [Candidatus Obscuribacterales bacterium]